MSTDDLTWDLTVPRAPGIDDLGGGQKVDRKGGGNPQTSLMAADANQWAKQLAAIGKTILRLGVSVRFSAGAPTYDGHDSITSIAMGDITLVDNGVGDTTVKWLKGRIPLPSRKPRAFVNGAAADYRIACESFSDATYDGVRVRTKDAAAAADVAFTVEI